MMRTIKLPLIIFAVAVIVCFLAPATALGAARPREAVSPDIIVGPPVTVSPKDDETPEPTALPYDEGGRNILGIALGGGAAVIGVCILSGLLIRRLRRIP